MSDATTTRPVWADIDRLLSAVGDQLDNALAAVDRGHGQAPLPKAILTTLGLHQTEDNQCGYETATFGQIDTYGTRLLHGGLMLCAHIAQQQPQDQGTVDPRIVAEIAADAAGGPYPQPPSEHPWTPVPSGCPEFCTDAHGPGSAFGEEGHGVHAGDRVKVGGLYDDAVGLQVACSSTAAEGSLGPFAIVDLQGHAEVSLAAAQCRDLAGRLLLAAEQIEDASLPAAGATSTARRYAG